ncbi:MAG: hypothetical protein HRU50_11620 [Winogradskyella sp.]|uniref:hypothetical protein n=1 Tax=Winogradskyella sp. TaxID=1883156 RepID=UPI0025D640C9|nr:hypothetical protein [Winogradskyella sp.]NRB60571.1 hypothetical protein [Winogradskyella sp.]
MNLRTFFFILSFLTISNFSFAQGKIGRAEDSLKDADEQSSNSESNSNSFDFSSSDDALFGNIFAELFGRFFFEAFRGVFIELPDEKQPFLTAYPYAELGNGNYSNNWNDTSTNWRGAITIKYISESSRIKGGHLNFDFKLNDKLAIELDYLQLWERSSIYENDQLAIYNAFFKYNRIRTKHFNAFWGIGPTFVDGAVDEIGISYAIGAEVFPIKPISFETSFNQTFINRSTLNRFQGYMNYHLKQYRFQVGYEYLKIGSQKFSNIGLGVGLYFN